MNRRRAVSPGPPHLGQGLRPLVLAPTEIARKKTKKHKKDHYAFVELTISSDACILSVYWSSARMMLSSWRSL